MAYFRPVRLVMPRLLASSSDNSAMLLAQMRCDQAGSLALGRLMSVRSLPWGTWMTYLRLPSVLS